jgi:hypothetical protein
MSACLKAPEVQQPWLNCERSAASFKFWVKAGFTGVIKVHKLPDETCLSFEECIYGCCCQSVTNVPVIEGCGCPLQTDCPTTLEVPPGEYQMVLTTCDGEALVPDPDEILVTVHHQIGGC